MTEFYISIISFVSFLMMESFLRFSKDAKSLKNTKYDKGTTQRLRLALFTTFFCIIGSIFLNRWQVLKISQTQILFWIGIIFIIFGFVLRIIAVLTLREYYTRTLKITAGHKVIKHGIYKLIRHPGYLGVMTLLIGCVLLTENIIAIMIILIVVPYSFIDRLLNEEKMLVNSFGDEYKNYMNKTYRLIPFIY